MSGATGQVVVQPGSNDVVYVGTVNGGVWKTTNATAVVPTWTALTDSMPTLSINSLAIDPTNTDVVMAGTGGGSNMFGFSTNVFGHLYISTNATTVASFQDVADPVLAGQALTGIDIRGNRVIATSFFAPGVFRSTGQGALGSWSAATTGLPSPIGPVIRLVADPTNTDRLFIAVGPNVMGGTAGGIFMTINGGQSWTRISTGRVQAALASNNWSWVTMAIGSNGRLFVSVSVFGPPAWIGYTDDQGANWISMEVPRFPIDVPGSSANTPIPILTAAGNPLVITTNGTHNLGLAAGATNVHVHITGVTITTPNDHSANGDWIAQAVVDGMGNVSTTQFTIIDPVTGQAVVSNGNGTGGTEEQTLSVNPGFQSGNAALAVDPSNQNLVYLSGDAGLLFLQVPVTAGPFGPNFTPFTVVVRGDASAAANQAAVPSAQWSPLVGPGTANQTSPHADSRAMAFDAAGRLLETCDGGIFRHSNPSASGDWKSLNASLATIELHDFTVDTLSGLSFGGAQDNGTSTQITGQLAWASIFGGDGGDAQVDVRDPTHSDRFYSSQNLGCLIRQPFDALGNALPGGRFPALCVSGTCEQPCVNLPPSGTDLAEANELSDRNQLIVRFAVNNFTGLPPVPGAPAAPLHMVFAGRTQVWESTDAGENVTSLGPGAQMQNFAYGHPNSPDALWAVGFDSQGVLARLNTGDPLAPTPAQPTTNLGGDWEQAVVMSANDHRVAYVVLAASAFTTPDGGAHWQDITGDLQATDPTNGVARAGRLHSIEYVPSANGDRLFVGGDFGVFMSTVANPTSWVRVGTNFPHAAVFDMKFDAARNVLTVGTVGRSAWQINAPGNLNRPPVALCKDAPVSANGSCQASVTRTDVDNGSFDPDGDSFNCVIDNGGPFGLGPHIVKLTCTDTSGTSSSCNSTVTVNDNTPPVVTCPVSVNVPCTNASGAVASWATSASDACSPPVTPVVCNRVSGSTFPLGNTFVTCTSNDAAGNTGSCLFNVTVALGDNPVCCPAGTNIILGTSNNDPLNGTAGSDCILGRGGQDTINGNGGNDFISGGDGDDIISGGAGNDLIFGGTGQDRITGDAGNDVMSGGDGDDRVSGGDGADVVLGGQGQDQLFGDNGNDTLAGETGDDHLEGGAGADLLIGGGLHDVCIGGPDLDTFLTCQTATQ